MKKPSKALASMQKKAKRLAKDEDIPLREAYEQLASEEGFESWWHFKKHLEAKAPSTIEARPIFGIYLIPRLVEDEDHISPGVWIPRNSGLDPEVLKNVLISLYSLKKRRDLNLSTEILYSCSYLIEMTDDLAEETGLPEILKKDPVRGKLFQYCDFQDNFLIPALLPEFAEDELHNRDFDEDETDDKQLKRALKKCVKDVVAGELALRKCYLFDDIEGDLGSYIYEQSTCEFGEKFLATLPGENPRTLLASIPPSITLFSDSDIHGASCDAENGAFVDYVIKREDVNEKGLGVLRDLLPRIESDKSLFVPVPEKASEAEVHAAISSALVKACKMIVASKESSDGLKNHAQFLIDVIVGEDEAQFCDSFEDEKTA